MTADTDGPDLDGTFEKVEQLSFGEGFDVAVAMHKANLLQQALEMYERLLKASPDFPDVLNLHGVALHQLGQSARGLASLRRCIELYPEFADAHNNYGNVLKELGDDDGARAAYERVLELEPAHFNALNNLAVVAKNQGEYQRALGYLEQVLEQNEQHGEAWHNMANVLEHLGHLEASLDCARNAVAYGPTPSAMYNLATALYKSGQAEEAKEALRRCIEKFPEDPVAHHQLAAYAGAEMPGRCTDAYVRSLFDRFAGSFETVLKGLDYRVPALIRDALQAGAGGRRVLDAGCGTGWCGEFLRPLASRLTGIDLSAGMLARAARTGYYDELAEAEITAYVEDRENAFDLIVVADTLCYFGDLGAVTRGFAHALAPGGELVLTVEAHDDDASPYRLNDTGRYSHRLDATQAWLNDAGLTVVSAAEETLRMEVGTAVRGYLVRAQQP